MATQAMPKGGTEVQNLGSTNISKTILIHALLGLVEVEKSKKLQDNRRTNKEARSERKKKSTVKAPTKKSNRPATPAERDEAKTNIIDKDGEATETQIKSIKNGLKKLREKDDTNEDFIKKR